MYFMKGIIQTVTLVPIPSGTDMCINRTFVAMITELGNCADMMFSGHTALAYITTPKNIRIGKINIDELTIRLANDHNNYKIIESPHYKYVCNDKIPYIDYYTKYMGFYLQDNHTPLQFDKLIENFNPITYNSEENRLIIINNKFQVYDGVHRLSILKKNKINNINVLMMT